MTHRPGTLTKNFGKMLNCCWNACWSAKIRCKFLLPVDSSSFKLLTDMSFEVSVMLVILVFFYFEARSLWRVNNKLTSFPFCSFVRYKQFVSINLMFYFCFDFYFIFYLKLQLVWLISRLCLPQFKKKKKISWLLRTMGKRIRKTQILHRIQFETMYRNGMLMWD